MAITNLLNISKQGIFVSQGSLQTVSHNISNVNTPGYSRQVVQQENTSGDKQDPGGSGVKVSDITRNFDQLVDRRMELGTGELGRLETREHYLTMVEDVFNDLDGEGFSQRLEAFYAAADALADNPTNPVGREELVVEADSLARTIQNMHRALTEMTLPVDKEISVVMEDINTRLKAIQQVNQTIVANENSHPALDLKDQRRQMVLELGELIDIQTIPMEQDGLRIMTSRGQELLADPVFAATLERSPKANEDGFLGININKREFAGSDRIRGGKLRGLLEIRDEVINGKKGFLTRLEAITDELRWQVNRVHSQSVSSKMYQSQQGIIELGADISTPVKDLVTDPKSSKYQKSPEDLSRVVTGEITFASGDTTDALTLSKPVTITNTMSLREIKDAINASEAVDAEIVTEGDKRFLKISAGKKGGVYGVLKDTSGILAALGVGAIFSGVGAGSIQVGKALKEDSKQVGMARFGVDNQLSPTRATFDDGNSQGAIALGNLRTAKFTITDQTASLTGHYATLSGNLGSLVNQNKESLVAQKSAQEFIGDLRESISGVSLEEELTDLIRYQRAFQASSKMVNVADELLQTLISMV
ncbi:MAG: flagellar hook-associated protein FlgK [Magnetococcales bacterium]|nr:flagellar hook-associated protein FlgK [Magnetococcales bacterium]MBF0149275.1 flagellar hook-associated protein FlgK [Magnetococcales bacterium]MBF0172807.1 flagellar hook-associated protein FlgK [Magnetococcales bacterium]MBF0632183.1 flagellar hook-associated protein FlgK [Magnetococcales bacterium]